MTGSLERQELDIIPPRETQVFAKAITTTAAVVDLTGLTMSGQAYNPGLPDDPCYLTMQAQSADAFFVFSSNASSSISRTASQASGDSTAAYVNTYCARLPQDAVMEVRIRRGVDKYLHVVGSAGGTIRLWFSSYPRNHGPA